MTLNTGYRYLDPAALSRVKNMSMVARGVVEGFISGLHTSPYKGFSIEFAEHRGRPFRIGRCVEAALKQPSPFHERKAGAEMEGRDLDSLFQHYFDGQSAVQPAGY